MERAGEAQRCHEIDANLEWAVANHINANILLLDWKLVVAGGLIPIYVCNKKTRWLMEQGVFLDRNSRPLV
ncbi:MAG: hypothetical protein CV081_00600 [Nitrospira sp. LK265]|nr:hypothetical protein [Nitrospira sp. LK265]